MRWTKAQIGALAAGVAVVMGALGELVHRDGVAAGLIVAIFLIAALAVLLLGLLAHQLITLIRRPAPRKRRRPSTRRPKTRRPKRRRVEIDTGNPAE